MILKNPTKHELHRSTNSSPPAKTLRKVAIATIALVVASLLSTAEAQQYQHGDADISLEEFSKFDIVEDYIDEADEASVPKAAAAFDADKPGLGSALSGMVAAATPNLHIIDFLAAEEEDPPPPKLLRGSLETNEANLLSSLEAPSARTEGIALSDGNTLSERCYLSAFKTCAGGQEHEGSFQMQGRPGVIARYDNSEFSGLRLGDLYSGWWWFFPYMCCGHKEAPSGATYAMCPKGAPDIGSVIGHIFESSKGDPYGNGGGDLKGGWHWRHPELCKPDNPKACVFAKTACPSGYAYKGKAGVIMDYHTNFPGRGGQYYKSLWWFHPLLCCKK